jgi:flagellar motor protein MotB
MRKAENISQATGPISLQMFMKGQYRYLIEILRFIMATRHAPLPTGDSLMMNSISRLMAFTVVAAAIATANNAHAQQGAAEQVAPANCINRSATLSPPAVDRSKDSAGRADSKAEEAPVLEISKEGLVRRTSLSAGATDSVENTPRQPVEEELSSRPQACYPPEPSRKAVDR